MKATNMQDLNSKNKYQIVKRNLFHRYRPLIGFCTLICLLSSCQKEADMADNNAVSFTSTIGTTKASGTTWDAYDQIGVYMYPAGGATASSANIPYTTATGNGSFAPSGSTSLYYPVSGNADFYAYYPYQQGMSGTIYKVNVAVQTNPKAIDLLRAVKTNVAKSKSAQNLQFGHQLARLTLTISAGTGVTNADLDDLSGVTIGSVSTTADFDVKTGLLTNPGNEQSVSLNLPADKRSGSALLIPGNIAGKKLSFSFGGSGTLAGKTFSYTFPNGTMLLSGKQHSYTIAVNATSIAVAGNSIESWVSGTTINNPSVIYSKYNVGDYYPTPGSPSTAIGIVFWIDPDNIDQGLIVSLDNSPSKLIWGSASADNATDASNGLNNFNKISGSISFYPAFKWCNDKNATAPAGITWYLPAKDELQYLYCTYNGVTPYVYNGLSPSGPFPVNNNARAAFNSALTAAGGTALQDAIYWTSTESGGNAWDLSFDSGQCIAFTSKSAARYVRAVAAYQ